ncbi:MAG: DUF4169 family protein [Nannocystaceae bacterium]|nr:DUF4169 family protein [Nannocystaceae bacterium]
MGDVLKLGKARKARAEAAAKARADANAIKHGRTRAQRELDRTQAERAARRLEEHRRDTGAAGAQADGGPETEIEPEPGS